MNSFQLALKAITRVGEEDFYVSGCQSIASGKKKASSLDEEYVANNLEPLLCELLACKAMGGTLSRDTKKTIQDVASRMARAGISNLSEDMQKKFTKKSIRVFGDITSRPKSILDLYEEEGFNEEPHTGDSPEDDC